MQSSWRIGTAFGIGIYIHWTFAILPALAFIQGWGEGGSGSAFLRFFALLAVCGCIVLHELGHALMARYFHIGTRDITLYPIGGVAEPRNEVDAVQWVSLEGAARTLTYERDCDLLAAFAATLPPVEGMPARRGRS